MSSPCNPNVSASGNMSERDSEALLQQMHNRANLRSVQTGQSTSEALKDIAGEIKMSAETSDKIYERNSLLNIQAKKTMRDFAKRFPTVGEGLRALLVGSNKNRQGARMSVDYQSKANNRQYYDKLVSGLESEGVLKNFQRSKPDFVQDVYREMAAMHPGQPAKQATENLAAHKAAKVIDSVYSEMIARQNRNGSFITRMPGYIIRQTHDMAAIRALGSVGNNAESRNESFHAWWEFTKPLLDEEKTFRGTDPEKTARLIHEGLYSGKHGPAHEESDLGYAGKFSDLGKKISAERVLHFKGPDEAYKYNQALGVKNFRDAIESDIHTRSRQIALLENMGPHFERNFEEVKNELAEEMRTTDQPAKHDASLKDWKLQADFNEVTGKNEFSANPTLSKYANFLKINAQLSKMGAVVLSKVVDAGAITSEMAHQGLNSLGAIGRGLRYMAYTSSDERAFARKLGVGMEAMMGNTLSRLEEHSSVYGWSHTLQKKFYSASLLPRWNDALRSSVAVALSNNLGENSHLPHDQLPGPLRSMLTQYDITPSRWDAMRGTAYDHEGEKFISPDRVAHDLTSEQLGKLVTEDGKKPTDANIERMRDRMETSLRTYYADRADYAIPTPGAKERKFATFNTQAGTPLGEFTRLAMMFKSFPITIMSKILGRDIYGNGADTVKQWLLNDNRGKVNMAMTIAMMTAAGYVSQTLHDLTNGKGPMPLISDGKINWDNVQRIMVRGGSLGLYGETTMGEFSGQYRSMAEYALGPTFGQIDRISDVVQGIKQGKNVSWPATKLLLDNAPFTNLFYLRPVLNYLILWHMQEMLSPGSLERSESRTEAQNHQGFLIRPSQHARQ